MGGCTSAPKVNDDSVPQTRGNDAATTSDQFMELKRTRSSGGSPVASSSFHDPSNYIKRSQTVPVLRDGAAGKFSRHVTQQRGTHVTRRDTPIMCPELYGQKAQKKSKGSAMKKMYKTDYDKVARANSNSLLEASAKRVARHQSHKWIMIERLQAIEASLPHRPKVSSPSSRSSPRAKSSIYMGTEPPEAPAKLAALYEKAMEAMDGEWASCDEVRALFAEHGVYVAPDKLEYVGKPAIVGKLNEGMQTIIDRIAQAGDAMKNLATGTKVKVKGPDRNDNGTWTLTYKFKMMMMTTIVIDTFTISDSGLILKLVRIRK